MKLRNPYTFEDTALRILNLLAETRPSGYTRIKLNSKVGRMNYSGVFDELDNKGYINAPADRHVENAHFFITEKGLNLREELLRKWGEKQQLLFNRKQLEINKYQLLFNQLLTVATVVLAYGALFGMGYNLFALKYPNDLNIQFWLNFLGFGILFIGIIIIIIQILLKNKKIKFL